MCGRYSFNLNEGFFAADELAEMIGEHFGKDAFTPGEIFPGCAAPVILAKDGKAECALSEWGFSHGNGKGIVINARSETVNILKLFSDAFYSRRAVVPATGYFEWKDSGSSKEKWRFTYPDKSLIYMAALYDVQQTNMRHVIMTAPAKDDYREVHDRMPLIIGKANIKSWLSGEGDIDFYMKENNPLLASERA